MRALLTVLLVILGLAAAAVIGGALVLRRPDIAYATLRETYATPASQYAELPDGLTAHFLDQGNPNGPPVLLVHGYSASTATWAPWVARLGERYRLFSLDLPGHGLTEAPAGYQADTETFVAFIEAFAAAKGLQKFTIVGSSMGGRMAWEYALAHPDRVDSLILVDAAGWPFEGARAQEPVVFKLLRNPVAGPLLRDLDTTALVRQGLQASFFNPALADDAMVTRYVELSRAPGHRAILVQLQEYGRSRLATPELLAQITAPTLILSGEQDNLVPVQHARQFAQAIPGSELVTFPNVGHIPQEEAPDESARVVADFLGRVYRSEPSPEAASAAAQAAQAAQ